MSTVRLDARRLATARRVLADLAAAVEAQRRAAVLGTPVTLHPLVDGGPAAQVAAWLHDQVQGLQDLEDLARLLETQGGSASYDGTGTFADAAARIGPEIAHVLATLDPADTDDLASLTGLAGLLQRHSGDPRVEDSLVAELGGSGLLAAFSSLVPVGPEPDATPAEVHAWWLGLTPAQQLAATFVQCRTYGNLDGIPAGVRDVANRASIPGYRRELLGMLEHPEAYDPDARPGVIHDLFFMSGDLETAEKLRALDTLEAVLGRGDRQLLVLDPFDGQQLHAAVAVGDVDTAAHVAVFTPGFTSTVQDSLSRYDAEMSDLRRLSQDKALRYGDGDSVATVTWLGYDAPQIAEVADWPRSVTMPGLARTGGDDLAAFYEGINASRAVDPHLTALGHSYGSLTTGYALQHDGTGVDDAILFGSPGTGTWHREDHHVPEGHLFVAEADDDPVADLGGTAPFGADPSHLPGADFLSTHDSDLPGGGHGAGSTGHSEYLRQESTAQYNIAVTVAGLDNGLRVTEGAPPLFRDGRPTGDFYSSVPDTAHRGYEAGREAVETGTGLVRDGLGRAWDEVQGIEVPW